MAKKSSRKVSKKSSRKGVSKSVHQGYKIPSQVVSSHRLKGRVSQDRTSLDRKLALVVKQIIVFLLIFILSVVAFSYATSEIFINLFLVLTILFGFLTMAFVIVLIILLVMKFIRR